MKIGIDTNILVYAAGFDDPRKQAVCARLLEIIPLDNIVVPLQVLAELHYVLTRKTKDKAFASLYVSIILHKFGVTGMRAIALIDGIELVQSHQFQIFDALILSQCAAADRVLLLTEDLQDGFQWKGCTVANPLADIPMPLLTTVLSQFAN